MKVSVVIPAYNEEAYLAACLDSLMKQEDPADEIIVVNNNSTDDTVAIAKRYPVRVITEKSQGRTPARNKGFNEAQYEIIARTDADTIVPPDWIKRIKKHFRDKELVAVSGPAHFYDLPEVVKRGKLTTEAAFSYIRIFKQIMKYDCLYGPNMALRKSAWELIKDEVCLDDKEVHEDIDIAVHLAPVGKILFDYNSVVESSFRRWTKIEPYFDYTNRMIKSIRKHKQFKGEQRGKDFMKKIMGKTFLADEVK